MTMRKIQLTANRSKSNSAWTKAPADVAVIAERMGFEAYDIDRGLIERASLAGRVLNKLGLLTWANRCVFRRRLGELRKMFKCAGGGELLIQHPVPNMVSAEISRIDELAGLKTVGVRIVVIVHDIGWFHSENPVASEDGNTVFERGLFTMADKLIVHNSHMKDYLVACGFAAKKMVELEIFDYLIDDFKLANRVTSTVYGSSRVNVMIAGGMGGWKASYLERLHDIDSVDWNLCGVEYDPDRIHGVNVHYLGCYAPEEVPFHLNGDFGLVWHGNSTETCAGRTGEYLKINNPHKLSLYLASNMPVIIWSQAAEADFVLRHKVGIVVDSLREVPTVVASLKDEERCEMQVAVREIGERLRHGYYLTRSLND